MKRLLLAATALLAVPMAAHASIIPVLDTVTLVGTEYEFAYSGTLAGDQGLIEGDMLVIFDFQGYVDGTISAGIYAADVDAYTELTSAIPPFFTEDDDPTIQNLVFKWKGAPFNASGGPFADVSFSGLTARSIYSGVHLDSYAATATQNNGAATGKPSYNAGTVGVPDAVIPEPATWGLMIMGFGLAGTALRTRRRLVQA